MHYYNKWFGLLLILLGMALLLFAIGDLLLRITIGLCALALINHGLRLRGLPPLQILIPLFFTRGWF